MANVIDLYFIMHVPKMYSFYFSILRSISDFLFEVVLDYRDATQQSH